MYDSDGKVIYCKDPFASATPVFENPNSTPIRFPKADDLIYRIEGGRINGYKIEPTKCTTTKTDPDIENVRVWVAPDARTIVLRDSISLLPDTSESRSHSHTADGVSYTIQLCQYVSTSGDNKHLEAEEYSILRQGSIAADDNSTHVIEDTTIHVERGDGIMYRVRSGDNNLLRTRRCYGCSSRRFGRRSQEERRII